MKVDKRSLRISSILDSGILFSFAGAGGGQERGGGQGQGDVGVPGVVAADLVLVVEADLVLCVCNDSSMAHRVPATRTSSRGRVPRGPKHR